MNDWTDPVIETASGGQIDLSDPDPAEIKLSDIATGLAHTCRFGGQCQQFYSVADHARFVSAELNGPRMQLLGLFHDAAEAYLGDVPRPLKTSLDRINTIEQRLLAATWEQLGVMPPTDTEWDQIMTVDDQLLAYEADQLLVDGSWAADPPTLDYTVSSLPPGKAKVRFQQRAEQLLAQV